MHLKTKLAQLNSSHLVWQMWQPGELPLSPLMWFACVCERLSWNRKNKTAVVRSLVNMLNIQHLPRWPVFLAKKRMSAFFNYLNHLPCLVWGNVHTQWRNKRRETPISHGNSTIFLVCSTGTMRKRSHMMKKQKTRNTKFPFGKVEGEQGVSFRFENLAASVSDPKRTNSRLLLFSVNLICSTLLKP